MTSPHRILYVYLFIFSSSFAHEHPLLVMSQVTRKTQSGVKAALRIPSETKSLSRCVQLVRYIVCDNKLHEPAESYS